MQDHYYKIYTLYPKKELIGIRETVEEVIEIINQYIFTIEHSRFIVLEHDIEFNMDSTFKRISSEEQFLNFIDEYRQNNKVKTLRNYR